MSIWRLPGDAQSLGALSMAEVVAAIWVRRVFIRFHRDQKGDDRCWLDDWFVWQLLDDTGPMPRYSGGEGMAQCELFYEHRRSNGPDTAPRGVIIDPEHWDDDLWHAPQAALREMLARLQSAIRAHRDIADRPRTADDDRALYDVLPEGIPADFSLPPRDEFLGEARAPEAGCPSFWRSHSRCSPLLCELHFWGPCGPPAE